MNNEELLISRLKSHLLDCSILKEEHKKNLEHYREMEMKIKAEQDLQSDEAFNKELFELQFKINALSLHMTYSSFAIIELNRILRLLGKEVLFDNQEMEDLFLDIIKGLKVGVNIIEGKVEIDDKDEWNENIRNIMKEWREYKKMAKIQ